MESDRICREEFQSAVGNVMAELYNTHDEFRHDRISRDAYVQRVATLRQVGQRFQTEFRQGHRIMAAPTR
jgi:hypothetical protein